MAKIFSAVFVFSLKIISQIFYRTHTTWHTDKDQIKWDQLRVIIALNHTSLFEFLFISAIPNINLWRAIDRLVVPVADVTLSRPFAGFFFRKLVPNAVSITRKRDDSWALFMESIRKDNSLILIFPEGRMMRKDGLDKHGKPMSIKGGVAEILEKLDSGKILIAYSGGLHHVQAPGELVPKVFKRIEIGFEQLDITEYKKSLDLKDFRTAVINDLEERKKKNC